MTWRTPAIAVTLLGVIFGPKVLAMRQPKILAKATEAPQTVVSSPQVIFPVASASALHETATVESKIASPSAVKELLTPLPTEATREAKNIVVTPKPTPTQKPQPAYSQEQIYKMMDNYGQSFGIDPNVLRHIAVCESGFRPEAKNDRYGGLFQFDSSTWKNYRVQMQLDTDPDIRFNAEEAVKTAAFALSKGSTRLWPACYPK